MAIVVNIPGVGPTQFESEEQAVSFIKSQPNQEAPNGIESTLKSISNSPAMTFIDQAQSRMPATRMASYLASKIVGPDKLSEERAAASPTAAKLGRVAGDVAVSIPEFTAGMGALKAVGPLEGGAGFLANLLRGAVTNTAIGQGTEPINTPISEREKRLVPDAALGAGGELMSAGIEKAGEALSSAPSKIMNRAIGTNAKEIRKGKDIGQELVDRGVVGTSGKLLKQAEEGLSQNEGSLQALLSQSGNVSKEPILNELQALKAEYSKVPGQQSMLKSVDDLIGEISADPKFDNLSASDANQMKRFIYNKVLGDKAYMSDKLPGFKESQKALARGLKNSIEAVAPEAAPLNQELSVWGRLKNAMLDEASKSEAGKSLPAALKHIAGIGGAGAVGSVVGGPLGATLGALGSEAARTTLGRTGSAQALSWLSKILQNRGGDVKYLAPAISGATR